MTLAQPSQPSQRSLGMANDDAGCWWNLLTTETGRELEIERELQKRGHDAYAPAETVWVRKSERGQRALFPGYVFVLVDGSRTDAIVEPRRAGERFVFSTVEVRHALSSIEARPGVIGFVKFGQRLASLRADVVEALRGAQAMCAFDRTLGRRARASAFGRGQAVRFATGPWQGLVGIVERADGERERVRLLLELLGRAVRVEASEADLVPA